MNADYFLLSSFDAIPDHYLQGFCFQDEDLILGDGGYDKYRISKGSDIQSGQDGAYVVVQKSDTGTRIGADSSGYFKLFLYKHKNHWAVSNSLVELAKFASSKNLPVSVDESHLSSFFIKGSFGNQLASLRTSVSEIQLVPASMEVFVFRSIFGPKVTLRPTPTISGFERRYQDYPDAIGEFLRLWIGRMATIMKSDLLAVSELTGGRDSRTNLSLMLAAAERFGTDLMQNVRITSSPAAEKDFAIAGQIASRFKLRFMDSSSDPRFARRMTTPQAYQKWKALCLGVYTPIYFPSARHTPTMVKFGGAGGESHRRFYPEMTPSKFIDNRKNFIPSSRHFK